MSRLYELGLRKEILRENFAGILADFMDYFKRNNLDYKTIKILWSYFLRKLVLLTKAF